MLIRGKRVKDPEVYPKGAEGRLLNDERFIDGVKSFPAKDNRDTCAGNNNPRAKPRTSDTKSALMYKRVFADCF